MAVFNMLLKGGRVFERANLDVQVCVPVLDVPGGQRRFDQSPAAVVDSIDLSAVNEVDPLR
eukprot:CAMPEP_0176155924 /NCGR_PEP_ID=MMETSP0120_2-20121206/79693_1 /TAXON_ID=160619 /ORGANISM="Kryptoperidinium foliaceum, Strain CCMP 1326" /LENGTH=60 /DNA_ID=CAMNT_0017493119 /DNA_START=75 /DNA_END=253 /DNA_ORIENTATION=+